MFTSKVKEAIHFVYGSELPCINAQAFPSKIQEWKSDTAVSRYYAKLFKRVSEDQPTTFVSKIIERLRREKSSPSKTQIAYAISVCETYLCPTNQIIQMNEGILKQKIVKNLVSFNLKL